MAKIKIKDLPKDTKISKAEMEKITGGVLIKDTMAMGSFDFGETTPILGWCRDGSSKKDSSVL